MFVISSLLNFKYIKSLKFKKKTLVFNKRILKGCQVFFSVDVDSHMFSHLKGKASSNIWYITVQKQTAVTD